MFNKNKLATITGMDNNIFFIMYLSGYIFYSKKNFNKKMYYVNIFVSLERHLYKNGILCEQLVQLMLDVRCYVCILYIFY